MKENIGILCLYFGVLESSDIVEKYQSVAFGITANLIQTQDIVCFGSAWFALG